MIIGVELYEVHHPERGRAVHVPWWTGVFYLGGLLNLWFWLELARFAAVVVAGALVGSWWALPIAALAIPEIKIVEGQDTAFTFQPHSYPTSVYVHVTLLYAAFIAFGVLAVNPRLRARLRGVRRPQQLERFTRHPYPLGLRRARGGTGGG